ncbi:chromosome segregation protein Csm1/Pcs1-domain-containing protein [Neohortaea acidophila]|uniref:Chromosome segregation protein Csm1/Pcs1-domain-containing protein n=1 Tax=Neohortaea acidophila TaxID=245834 RepID=A0A6A6PYI5_9PEZI|nr:chromosome segregation protein Csm1/Pcs1-domain-containing protein [Neohortaea acidophila]KAF2485190.1 chromosome segregation protein Csm1/Pcs1-domain-containing protein [Neohortaea acidophila]
MAPYTNLRHSFAEAGALDSEDDLLATATTASDTRRLNSKMARGTKAKAATTRRVSATKRKAPAKPRARQPLKDTTNIQAGSDTEEVEQFDGDDVAKPKAKRAKTTTTTAISESRAPAKPRTTKRAPVADTLRVIPETQPDPEQEAGDVSQSIEIDEMDIAAIPTPPPPARFAQRPRSTSVQPQIQALLPRPSARSASVQAGYPPPRERSGSASGAERERRGGDPELRRKLNDVTQKYEKLNLKYQNLQEVKETGAQSSFEKLKRASEQKAKDADALVAGLKKELAELKKASAASAKNVAEAKENEALQKQLSSATATNSGLATENANLKSSLQVAQNEVKALEAKLVAARQQSSAQEENKKGAMDGKNNLSRSVGPNATDAQKEAKMKENLYSDLTGLIIRGVKRKEGEDEYDCIQTGRNGTLHFHLSVANDSSIPNPRTPSGLSYGEAEFAYEPLLDESRDRDLMDILPDYLTEEICFPRNHAVKFYTRVLDSMTKKVDVVE